VQLGVRATRGTVLLTGTVESLRQKLAAERSALETVGVWAVENALQVRPALDLADDELLGRLRDRIRRDAVAGGADIRVEVANARAILRGNVSSREEKVLAEIAVAGEPALIAVDNRLSVDKVASPLRDDLAIEDEIESRLSWDARVDPARIFVEVHDGVALLRGEVASRTVYDATFALSPDRTRYVARNTDTASNVPAPGLPFSLVFRAEPGAEDRILKVASAYEAASKRRVPPPAYGPVAPGS